MTMTKRISLMACVLILCVGCDQTTKSVAESFLSETPMRSFLGDTLRLQLAHNSGAFLGLGASLPEAARTAFFSVGVSGLLLVLLGYAVFAKSVSTLEILAYSLLLAGGVGNLIDRVVYGYAVDFMNIGIGPLRTGVFNIADIAVSVGVLILIGDSLNGRNQSV